MWIAERAGPRDIVVTSDVPLASRCVKAGASVLAPNGRAFTNDSIGMALATRNLLEQIRDSGEITVVAEEYAAVDRRAPVDRREVVAGNPKIYGQLVTILAPYTRVIKDDESPAAAADEGAQVQVEVAPPAAPRKRTAVRIKKSDTDEA